MATITAADSMAQRFTSRQKVLAVVGVAFAFGFPAIPIGRFFDEFANTRNLVAYELIWWAAVAVVLLYVRFAEGEPFSSIGFRRPGWKDILLGIACGVVILAGLAAILYVVFPALHISEDSAINQVMATPLWWRWISVIRAAVGEEILFRSYAIERLQKLTGSARVAGFVSWAVFTLLHVGFWGWGHLLVAGFAGGLLTLLYMWRRNLWGNMLAHFIVDGAAFLS
jgi:uncharacterized protein